MTHVRFAPVDRVVKDPARGEFVLSFIEVAEDRVIVRLRVTGGDLSEFTGPVFDLRDDLGTHYPWSSSASGGLVSEEVLHAFVGSLASAATTLELSDAQSANVLARIVL